MVLEMLLPYDYGEVQSSLLMQKCILNFVILFHNFWPDCLSMLLCQLVLPAINKLIYDRDVD